MDKEIKRIDQKVQAQLNALTVHEQELDVYFEGKLKEENEREKPRVTYIESINTSRNNNRLITEAARELMEFTTSWNLVKEKLDASCLESDRPNVEAFAVALAELVDIKPKDLFKKITRVKRIPRWLKKNTPLRSDLLNQYDFMQRVYKNAPKHLKRMMRSDAQNAAVDRASLCMKMRWGGF